jgi:hypothetical protein
MPTLRPPHGTGDAARDPRRKIGSALTLAPVPAGETTDEAGAPRLYVPVASTRSMSPKESGPPRLYVSGS